MLLLLLENNEVNMNFSREHQGIKFHKRPEGILKFRKNQLALGIFIILSIIIITTVLKMENKKEQHAKAVKKQQSTEYNVSSSKNKEQWFEKYDIENIEIPETTYNREQHIIDLNHDIETYSNTNNDDNSITTRAELSGIKISFSSRDKYNYTNENNSSIIKKDNNIVAKNNSKEDPKVKFSKQGNFKDSNYLQHTKISPISSYELKAGSVIPAILISGINSDTPGRIIGQVRENVYDSATGNLKLIPQGTKIIGQYDSGVSYGQNRALVIWSRLIFPNGDSINLDNMQGVDGSGYSGFADQVDNHYLRTYGSAILLSFVGAGYEYLNQNASSEEDTLAGSIGRELASVTSEITRKNINVAPTIKIRPGYKFNVMVMSDMILD